MQATKAIKSKNYQAQDTSYWWEREDLNYVNRRLQFCGRDLKELAGYNDPHISDH